MPKTDGWLTSRDICNQAVIERVLQDESVTSIKISATLQSDNFSSGSAGWQIRRDTGSAEFQDVTIRGTITAGSGSDVDWSFISNVAINNADVVDVSADKLTAGTIDASVITVTNLNASNITTGTITARHYRTASSGTRLEINPGVSGETGHGIDLYVSGTKRGSVDADTTDTVVALSGANGWGAKISSSLSEVEAEGDTAHMLGDSGAMLIEASPTGGLIRSPFGSVALTAYRQRTQSSTDIAHFRSDFGSTDSLHALIKVDGDLQNTNNSYGGISDERLKKNIETARSYLDDLRKIRVTKHTLKATGQRLLGPIAQEVREVFPGLVTESEWDGEKVLSVKHSVFVPMAITAIQELADDRDDFRTRLEALENA